MYKQRLSSQLKELLAEDVAEEQHSKPTNKIISVFEDQNPPAHPSSSRRPAGPARAPNASGSSSGVSSGGSSGGEGRGPNNTQQHLQRFTVSLSRSSLDEKWGFTYDKGYFVQGVRIVTKLVPNSPAAMSLGGGREDTPLVRCSDRVCAVNDRTESDEVRDELKNSLFIKVSLERRVDGTPWPPPEEWGAGGARKGSRGVGGGGKDASAAPLPPPETRVDRRAEAERPSIFGDFASDMMGLLGLEFDGTPTTQPTKTTSGTGSASEQDDKRVRKMEEERVVVQRPARFAERVSPPPITSTSRDHDGKQNASASTQPAETTESTPPITSTSRDHDGKQNASASTEPAETTECRTNRADPGNILYNLSAFLPDDEEEESPARERRTAEQLGPTPAVLVGFSDGSVVVGGRDEVDGAPEREQEQELPSRSSPAGVATPEPELGGDGPGPPVSGAAPADPVPSGSVERVLERHDHATGAAAPSARPHDDAGAPPSSTVVLTVLVGHEDLVSEDLTRTEEPPAPDLTAEPFIGEQGPPGAPVSSFSPLSGAPAGAADTSFGSTLEDIRLSGSDKAVGSDELGASASSSSSSSGGPSIANAGNHPESSGTLVRTVPGSDMDFPVLQDFSFSDTEQLDGIEEDAATSKNRARAFGGGLGTVSAGMLGAGQGARVLGGGTGTALGATSAPLKPTPSNLCCNNK